MIAKAINFCKENGKDIVLASVVIMVALIGFGLGRLSKIRENKTPITIENLPTASGNIGYSAPVAETQFQNTQEKGTVVVSKNGTKYHYPWCSGAQSIKEENKIWFASEEEARKAGYTPASNCKGLK